MPLRNFLVIALAVVISLACYSVAAKNRYANLFAEVMDVVNQEALREIPKKELFEGAMNGLLRGLDEHSVYISDQGFKAFNEDMKQEFGGVGMYVETDPKTKMLMVLAPMPGTPAYEAGIHVGDLIVTIAGEPTVDKARIDAVKSLRGPIGETVDVEIRRGEQSFVKSLKRAKIPIESTHGDYRMPDGKWVFQLQDEPNIGYIRLSQFGEKSAKEFAKALEDIQPGVRGLIIDIRANTGGLLHIAVDICDMFLEDNLPIVRIRGRNRELKNEYLSESGTLFPADMPVCILMDRYSASASEILAGCLQDHGRAVLIGEQTYGKGTVQDIIPIQQNKSMLKLTTASYWRPSGKHIDRNGAEAKRTETWGVQPDAGFEIEMDADELLQNLRSRNARDVEGLSPATKEIMDEVDKAKTETGSDIPESPTTPSESTETDDQETIRMPHVDRPLQKAIEYLQSRIVSRPKAA
jgi:carboxyl-terminal processing protease